MRLSFVPDYHRARLTAGLFRLEFKSRKFIFACGDQTACKQVLPAAIDAHAPAGDVRAGQERE